MGASEMTSVNYLPYIFDRDSNANPK